ncbi:AI-2E family transporter, partial [Streptomyces griseiscabiei]
MSRVPGWLGRLGAGLSGWGERLERRRAEIESETEGPRAAAEPEPGRGSGSGSGSTPVPDPGPAPDASGSGSGSGSEASGEVRGRATVAVHSARPEPASVVPWGMRVAAEAGWRLLVLAGTVWVLMRVISSIQLLVLSFTTALLVTALLQPTVARLTRYGVPRGLATAMTAVLGFVVMGLIGWFVTWQVMENIDDLSDQIQDGIDELQRWLLDSPFHVTENQINDIAKNLREAISDNTDTITSAGLEGVTVLVEALTGILLTMFSTLFLLYDGKRIWQWTLKLVPAAARPGVSAAG